MWIKNACHKSELQEAQRQELSSSASVTFSLWIKRGKLRKIRDSKFHRTPSVALYYESRLVNTPPAAICTHNFSCCDAGRSNPVDNGLHRHEPSKLYCLSHDLKKRTGCWKVFAAGLPYRHRPGVVVGGNQAPEPR